MSLRARPPLGLMYAQTGHMIAGMPPMPPMPIKMKKGKKMKKEASVFDSDEEKEAFEYDFTSGKGAASDIANIYRSKKDSDGEWTYLSELPDGITEAAENAETEKCCLVIRNKKSQDSRKKLEAESIIIQSPWLKKALSDVLKDYPGVACELRRLVFSAPYAPFVHRWTEFIEYMEKEDLDAITRDHMKLLHKVLLQEVGDKIKDFEDYVQNGVITYDCLWMIFQPGTIVISEQNGAASVFELVETVYAESMQSGKSLRLDVSVVDWDGRRFGRTHDRISVPTFVGTRKITSLNAFPIHFHKDKEEIQAQLIARGRTFEQLAGNHYKAYNGRAIGWDSEGKERPVEISGRIIIDAASFNRFSGLYCSVSAWSAKDKKLLAEQKEKETSSDNENTWTKVNVTDGSLMHAKTDKKKPVKLSPYHQMLCRNRVKGYSLKLKKWLEFFVPMIHEIEWNSKAFSSLVLPEKQKELDLAFSESQVANQTAFDDVIAGKGRGVIMLLFGKPGVGKTLTAEAVAEHMHCPLHCPLHSITSGDLGSPPHEVEQSLTSALELVSRWNAVLLVDECDVFLEARANHDIERNRLVSIFLRTLEYFEGILFMTTNRMNNIDPAFHSRIHISLNYPELAPSSRRQIWDNFLNGSQFPHTLSEQNIDGLSIVELNGRQIKNVLKTSQLLALRNGENLSKAFVETVLSIEQNRAEGKMLGQ
ncbi:ATPase [Tothia fuscella]|uniref:ATPase n=1 Tax=Tothia fuscella TaxID=1048955 RepID=A0A9P4NE84_9PEZI|nr:ATPase [Tothia fuscella]